MTEEFDKLKEKLNETQNEMRIAMVAMGEEFARVHSHIDDVNKEVLKNGQDILDTRKDLITFTIRFEAFVSQIEKENNLTHAQGEVVILNQEIEKKFGLYDKVRKVLLGILQSVDTGLVSKNSITCATEKLMLGTPRYWLTPSLIAIAAWLSNDETLAIKGLNEGLKRNLVKTELMFTLVNNRLKRNNASFIWLSKYFESQNPLEMPQETLILLGAYADGIFGPDSHGICRKQITKWLDFLSKDEERVKSLEKIWFNKIDLLDVEVDDSIPFNTMSSTCMEWENLNKLLISAKKQKSLLNYIKNIIEAKDIKGNYIKDLDDLLYKLINEYDEDEFELKKKKALAELIIKYQGDKEKAQQDFETNVIILFKNKVSFFDILVNSVNQNDMSPSLRKLALLLMKEWIINAHNDFTANYRKAYPQNITIKISDWSGTTKDGSNLNELLESYNNFLQNIFNKALNLVKKPVIIKSILFFACLIWMFGSSFHSLADLVTVICGFALIKSVFNYFSTKSTLTTAKKQDLDRGKQTIHAFCAEFVDWQKAYKNADKIYADITKTLSRYSSAEFTANNASNKIITSI